MSITPAGRIVILVALCIAAVWMHRIGRRDWKYMFVGIAFLVASKLLPEQYTVVEALCVILASVLMMSAVIISLRQRSDRANLPGT